jgi:cyclin-dependent kinase 8/11
MFYQTDTEFELIQQGPVSNLYRTKWTFDDGRDSIWVAVKAATVNHRFSKEPHDIKKEVRILSGLSHENVCFHISQYLPLGVYQAY